MKTLSVLLLSIFVLWGCNKTDGKITKQPKKEVKQTTEKVQPSLKDTVFTFENETVGKLPTGWSQSATGRDKQTEWKIVDVNGNKALAQLSAKHPSYHFNVVVYDGFSLKNMKLKVKIKGFKGRIDRGGGFVWRFTDPNNYYVVRENPLENNVVLYKVVNGRRTDLPLVGKGRTYGVDVPPLGSGWNELSLTVKDDLFTVYLNGKELFKVKDTTFTNAGKVGLWTKADAVSYFDNFEVHEIK